MTVPETMTNLAAEAAAFKEAGNSCYKENDISGALENYTKAIEICEEINDEKLLATCLKNRAAVFLKEEDYELVVSDCTRALEIVPNDPKSLFRRCQAHEALKQVDSAYKDAREVHRVDPKNPAIEPVLVRLHKAVSEKVVLQKKITANHLHGILFLLISSTRCLRRQTKSRACSRSSLIHPRIKRREKKAQTTWWSLLAKELERKCCTKKGPFPGLPSS